MRSLDRKTTKPIKSLVFIVLSLIMILSVMGAGQNIQDIFKNIREHGTECTFRARILEKITPDKQRRTLQKQGPMGQGLVVQKTPTSDVREERILVLVTKDTKIGYQVHGPRHSWRSVALDNLEIETHVLIKGMKIIEKADSREIIIVEAERIELVE